MQNIPLGFIQDYKLLSDSCDLHLHFELRNQSKQSSLRKHPPLLNCNAPKKYESFNEIMGPASPDSQCDDTLSDPIWKGLNVLKCKWLGRMEAQMGS